MFAETYRQLITDQPHWMFELSVEAITSIVVYPFAHMIWRRAVRRHDRKVHHVD